MKQTSPAMALCGPVALLALLSSCSSSPAPDLKVEETAIRKADAEWSKAAEARDLDRTVSYYSSDAQLLPPHAPIAVGPAAIRAAWEPLLAPPLAVSWKASKVEVAKAADLAYVVGTYSIAMKDSHGKPADDTGKLIEVWKKQADGKWKCVADTFNSDLPIPAPPKPAKKHGKATSKSKAARAH